MMADTLITIAIVAITFGVAYIIGATKGSRDTKCYLSREKEGYAQYRKCHGMMGGDGWSEYLSYDCMDCKYFIYPDIKRKGEKDD